MCWSLLHFLKFLYTAVALVHWGCLDHLAIRGAAGEQNQSGSGAMLCDIWSHFLFFLQDLSDMSVGP